MELDEQVQAVESSATGHTMTSSGDGDALRNLDDGQRDHWLKTGELPGKEKAASSTADEKKSDGTTTKKEKSSSSPAQGSAEVAEEQPPESATGEEQGSKPKPTGAEARIKELDSEVKTLKTRLAQLDKPPAKAEPAGGDKPDSTKKAEAKPAPNLEDFETLDEYMDAKIEWGIQNGIAKVEAERTEAAQRTELQNKQQEAQDRLNQTFDHGKKTHADFEEKALDPTLKIIENSTFDRWLMDPDMSPETRAELLYHYGTHREELDKLNSMPTHTAIRELTRVESTLKTPASSKAESKPAAEKKVSSAPPPGSEVGSKGTPTEDPRAKAIADGDAATYMALENSRELARTGGSRK